jgi:hypothetical protein
MQLRMHPRAALLSAAAVVAAGVALTISRR